mgnify:CR=1 FL=1
MELSPAYESDTGLPTDKSYLECGLPDFLMESIARCRRPGTGWIGGEKDLRWDCDYCNLQTDINNAEVNQVISQNRRGISGRSICGWKGSDHMGVIDLQVCQNGTRHTPARTARRSPSSMTGSNIC